MGHPVHAFCCANFIFFFVRKICPLGFHRNFLDYIWILSIAGIDKSNTVSVRLDGKNYFPWEFNLRVYIKGRDLWGMIDGTDLQPTESTKLKQWTINDAKIMSWILNSVEPQISINLRPYETARDM